MHVILSRGFSGSERAAVEQCNYLAEAGHEVAIALRWWQPKGAGRRIASIRGHLDPRIRIWRIPRHILPLRALRKAVQSFAPDIVHAHLARAAGLVARLQVPVVKVASLHMHEFDPAYMRSDGLLYVAQWQRRLIPVDYPGETFFVPSIVRSSRGLAQTELQDLRRQLGISPREYVIGGVGRLIERKGWDTLIRAFRSADLPCARLLIVGEGKERSALQSLGDSRMVLPGFRDNALDYFQIMDLAVCPSRHEAFGLVVVEALAAGVPVVASDTEGCREILSHLPGDLFPVDDSAALSRLLTRHYEARTPRARIDIGAYLPERSGALLVSAYASLLESMARRSNEGHHRRVM